jgi:hypothetical protein
MSKKKKISTFKRDRVREIISNLSQVDSFEKYNMTQEYYESYIKNNKESKTFKNIGKFSFFTTTYDNQDAVLIYSILSFPMEKKDSIEINDQVMNVIDFIEKLFVEINNVNMLKFNSSDSKEHYVFLKMVLFGNIEQITNKI